MQQHPPQSSWNQQAPPQQTGWAQSQPPQQPPQQQQHPPQQSQWNAGQQSNYPQQQQQGPPQQWNNQQYGQQQYGGQQQYPGQWQQPGMCSCCDQCCQQPGQCCQQPGQCCQCQPPYGAQVDPYCCGAPIPEQPDTTMCCDFTCWFVCLFFVMTLIGLAVVLGVSDRDNIFSTFSVASTRELATAVNPYIPYQVLLAQQCAQSTVAPSTTTAPTTTMAPATTTINASTTAAVPTTTTTTAAPATTTAAPTVATCTKKDLFGSFGTFCLEDSLNAGTFAANLSHWNNFRGTLYFLAFIITLIFMIVVYAVHRQKNPMAMSGSLNASASGAPQGFAPSAPINLYGTDLYEVFRCAWFVSGTIIFFWVANAMTSYWGFSKFYKDNTTGKLQDFWVAYDKKFVASVVCVTLYLAWPLFLIGAELGIWILFILPYMGVRCMLKPGLENIRPEVPDSEMPGWVRADVFFMEIQQIRRFGFSNRLWEMVTGSKEAFVGPLDCCQMNNLGPQGVPSWQQQQLPPPQQPPARPGSTTGQTQAPRPGQMDGSIEMRRMPPPHQQPVPQQPAAQMQMSSSFFPQREDSMQPSDSMVVRSIAAEGSEVVKEKKEKKHKHDKKEKSKEKKDKTSTKEKKEKKHKHEKKDKHDSD